MVNRQSMINYHYGEDTNWETNFKLKLVIITSNYTSVVKEITSVKQCYTHDGVVYVLHEHENNTKKYAIKNEKSLQQFLSVSSQLFNNFLPSSLCFTNFFLLSFPTFFLSFATFLHLRTLSFNLQCRVPLSYVLFGESGPPSYV